MLFSRIQTQINLSIVIGLLIVSTAPVWAEGSKEFDGAFGVNRVVRTKSTGYVEAEGTFTVSATLPDPDKVAIAKIHENRPNPYLGGRVGDAEYDGGLIWEPNKVTINGVNYKPGWTAFIRGGDIATNPRVLQGGKSYAWRYRVGQTSTRLSISSKVRLTFRKDGKVSLYIGLMPHSGRFFLRDGIIDAEPGVAAIPATATSPYTPAKPAIPVTPTQSQGLVMFRPAQLRTANVKRVAALTRAGTPLVAALGLIPADRGFHDELDGSVVTITWLNGRVRKRGGTLRPWVSSDVNQSETGYDGAPDNTTDGLFREWDWVTVDNFGGLHLSRDSKGRVTSRKTVSFPNLEQKNGIGRRSSPASVSATEKSLPLSVSRYTQETVRISLRQASAPWGRGK